MARVHKRSSMAPGLARSSMMAPLGPKRASMLPRIEADARGSMKRVSVSPTASQQPAERIQKSLSTVKIFKDMDATVLKMLPEIVISIICKAGTVLFKQGDPPGCCYVIISGSVGVYVAADEEGQPVAPQQGQHRFSALGDTNGFLQDFLPGQKTVDGFSRYHDDINLGNRVSKLSPGSVLGELALMNDQPRLASAKCLEDAEFFVIRRNDFDNVLKEEMVKKGDEKLRFLMRHLPGMKEVPVPKPGGKPHASYMFKHGKFPRGHTFLVQGKIAEPHLWVVYKGAVEFRRAEILSLERLERMSGDDKKSMPHLRPLSALKKAPKGLSASQPRLRSAHGIGRDGNVAAEANDCNPNGVMSRRGVLVQGGVFGSLPFHAPEPFTVRVTSPMCEVFLITSADFPKIPRKLLDVVQDYVAAATTWRLSCHQKSTNFRRQPQKPTGMVESEDGEVLEEEVTERTVDVSELLEECREERKSQFADFQKAAFHGT
ncbi:Cyclic nucleotide-binding domain-containing protein [Durusdinium trenchii]|uniref:Cyclic nucleotide-binding domain-containing protein n=2 Tax=Durusdinium trenchii TaxID=1381693 RepID=A0ABP0KBH0_9DINO